MRVKRLTRCALLTAIALAIFVLEAQIPIPFPVPGMKLGLSNIITRCFPSAGRTRLPSSLSASCSAIWPPVRSWRCCIRWAAAF
mgnify:CR=1 FL=1